MSGVTPIYLLHGITKKNIYFTCQRANFENTYGLSLLIIKFEKLQAAVCLQRSVQVPNLVVDLCNHRVVSEALALGKMQHLK